MSTAKEKRRAGLLNVRTVMKHAMGIGAYGSSNKTIEAQSMLGARAVLRWLDRAQLTLCLESGEIPESVDDEVCIAAFKGELKQEQ